MTLYPKSLRGRLALLFIGVLLLAQLFSATLHFKDRGRALLHATGFNSAQRIAGLVRVLDPMTPKQRIHLVKELDLPPLRLSLANTPEALPDDRHNSPRAELFHQVLHLKLGRNRAVQVTFLEIDPVKNQEANASIQQRRLAQMHAMMVQRHGVDLADSVVGSITPRLNFIAQIQLQGGQWAQFVYYLPNEQTNWPLDLLFALLILLASVLVVSFFAVRWLTRPLSSLANAARDLGKDIQHPPLQETGPTEVRHAARAFNTMQRRLSRFVQERAGILAAVSHDLKTPITRMRLRVEGIEDLPLREKFERDLKDMQTLVQSSLDFMRGMAIKEQTQTLDIDSLLDSLAEDAREMGHTVTVNGESAAPYSGKPLALKRCLENLIDNAIRYGQEADIEIKDSDTELTVIIRDRGPGLPEDALEHVFEPFKRMESSRNSKTGGTGLGLSIARNIARAHGGELWLLNRKGGGLEAWLSLPHQ